MTSTGAAPNGELKRSHQMTTERNAVRSVPGGMS